MRRRQLWNALISSGAIMEEKPSGSPETVDEVAAVVERVDIFFCTSPKPHSPSATSANVAERSPKVAPCNDVVGNRTIRYSKTRRCPSVGDTDATVHHTIFVKLKLSLKFRNSPS